MRMKAAVLHSTPGKLSVEEIDIADPGPNEVRVKIVASGLCHTDWETMHGYQPVNLPAVIGHEGAGVVESVGPGVTHVKVGDHVACSWSPNCGHCFYCDHGQPILCEGRKRCQWKRATIRWHNADGLRREASPLLQPCLVTRRVQCDS